MTKVCAVFCGGEPVSHETVRASLAEDALRIAADSGYKLMEDLGITPHLVIGDFDSAVKPKSGCVMEYPVEKDDTDLMLAVREGLARGCTQFLIYGATGGRLDHTVATLQTLAFLRAHNAHGTVISDTERVELLSPGTYHLKAIQGYSLSLFAYSDTVTDLTVTGAKYKCFGITLSNTFPLGVSNEVTADEAWVSFKMGTLLCIRSKL